MHTHDQDSGAPETALRHGEDHRLARESHLARQVDAAGRAASAAAAHAVFGEYTSRRARQTLRRQRADLRLFGDFLHLADITLDSDALQFNAELWRGMKWGLVEAFKQWMLREGFAIGSVNARLSTIRTYARLAFKAGVLSAEDFALIRQVAGFSQREGRRVDEKRHSVRIGSKKDRPTRLTAEQAAALKQQPDTPQGRRDALLMSLLLDHGLRVGEVSLLEAGSIDLERGLLRFFRPKVNREQVHRMTADTHRAAYVWFAFGDAPAAGKLLRSSRKGGELTAPGMTERAITQRVRLLGRRLGIEMLSAHDCRHYWATHAARAGTDPFALQEAGGWNSLAMPRRYVEAAKIANEGVKGF